MNAFVDFNGNPLRVGSLVTYHGHTYTISHLNSRTLMARLISAYATLTLTAAQLALSDRV